MAVFGELIAAYLFLAGTGAGGIAVASLADLLAVRAPFGEGAPPSVAEASPAERLAAFTLAASWGALALGTACLAADLGRIDRVLALFLAPAPTLMNLGAWALAALIAVGGALVLVRFLYLPQVTRRVVVVGEVVAVALAAVVAVYAGLLLSMLPGVRLWASPAVPVLFVLSAASCGCAVVVGAALFVENDGEVRRLVRRVLTVDIAVVVAEMAAAAWFLGAALASDHPGVAASAESLLHGSAALPWWIGFGLCGLLVPLVAETVLGLRGRSRHGAGGLERFPVASRSAAPVPDASSATTSVAPAVLAVLAACVLVGGIGLRGAIEDAGAHRPLELRDPASVSVGTDPSPAADVPHSEREESALWSN